MWFGSQLQCAPTEECVSNISIWLNQKFEDLKISTDLGDYNLSFLANSLCMIWKGRNNATFNNQAPNPYVTINQAISLSREVLTLNLTSRGGNHPQPAPIRCKTWKPPPLNSLKCNTDAAFDKDRRIAAIAAVIRDSSRALLAGCVRKIPCAESIMAEALAVREGVFLASNCGCDCIIIEFDNLAVVEACRSQEYAGILSIVIEDICQEKSKLQHCGFVWTPREANSVAYQVAQLGLAGNLPKDWAINYPIPLRRLLDRDRSHCL